MHRIHGRACGMNHECIAQSNVKNSRTLQIGTECRRRSFCSGSSPPCTVDARGCTVPSEKKLWKSTSVADSRHCRELLQHQPSLSTSTSTSPGTSTSTSIHCAGRRPRASTSGAQTAENKNDHSTFDCLAGQGRARQGTAGQGKELQEKQRTEKYLYLTCVERAEKHLYLTCVHASQHCPSQRVFDI